MLVVPEEPHFRLFFDFYKPAWAPVGARARAHAHTNTHTFTNTSWLHLDQYVCWDECLDESSRWISGECQLEKPLTHSFLPIVYEFFSGFPCFFKKMWWDDSLFLIDKKSGSKSPEFWFLKGCRMNPWVIKKELVIFWTSKTSTRS